MPAATPGGALALLTIPYVFTQDELLTTHDFLAKAKDRGHNVSLDGLRKLHSHGLLVPLFRVSDVAVEGRRIDVPVEGWPNARGWTFQAAAEGRLRDSAEEGYSAAWPYARPADQPDRRWWNGFVYSSWQLLHLGTAVNEYQSVRNGLPRHVGYQRRARERKGVRALAALSTRYLPGVLGKLVMRGHMDEEGLRSYRARSEVADLLAVAGIEPTELQAEADNLLGKVSREPLAKWLKLVRYASYDGWSQLRGEPLGAMWHRVAAEILLRAYEDIAAEGVVEPLPDLTGAQCRVFQHDGLSPQYDEAPTLERALAELGLSPHPKVILLVEGETELCHVPRLLAEFGITQPQDVRVQRTKSSKINAHLIARYGVTPRVGRKIDRGWLLDATLTALVIAMDPENDFETPVMRDGVRRKLQDAIREEVEYQDASINQDELDHLVHVRVWGDDKYELANFSDDELVPAITTIATSQHNAQVSSPTWEANLRAELAKTRAAHDDIKVTLGRMRVKEDKVRLAELLWSVLRAKCEAEYANGTITTPVLQLVLDVQELVWKVQGVRALQGDET